MGIVDQLLLRFKFFNHDGDGRDDDCDGRVDEAFIGQITGCGVGACSAQSQQVCENGIIIDTCVPGAGNDGPDQCDGADSDCDGRVDENHVVPQTTCGIGACISAGQLECNAGRLEDSCEPNDPAEDDVTCDGSDDDCDGINDEDYGRVEITCGVGV